MAWAPPMLPYCEEWCGCMKQLRQARGNSEASCCLTHQELPVSSGARHGGQDKGVENERGRKR
eukprot:1161007-Pelagomonas_calceolata.AAC.4